MSDKPRIYRMRGVWVCSAPASGRPMEQRLQAVASSPGEALAQFISISTSAWDFSPAIETPKSKHQHAQWQHRAAQIEMGAPSVTCIDNVIRNGGPYG